MNTLVISTPGFKSWNAQMMLCRYRVGWPTREHGLAALGADPRVIQIDGELRAVGVERPALQVQRTVKLALRPLIEEQFSPSSNPSMAPQ